MEKVEYAHVRRSGVIVFSENDHVPGLLPLGSGGEGFRDRVDVLARHGYRDGELLVPGVPEAADDDDAFICVAYFKDILSGMGFAEAAARHDVVGVRNRALAAFADQVPPVDPEWREGSGG